MRSLLQVKKETKIIDSGLIVSIISRLVVTSKLNVDDELISSLVSCIQTSKGMVKSSDFVSNNLLCFKWLKILLEPILEPLIFITDSFLPSKRPQTC